MMKKPSSNQSGFMSRERPRIGAGVLMNGLSLFAKGFQAFNQYRALREHESNIARITRGTISGLQEDIYLKTYDDAVSAGFIDPNSNFGRGIYCGELKDTDGNSSNFQITTDSHVIILGRAGSFKTKALVEPMAYRLAEAKQSQFIFDIKEGELADELEYGLTKIYGKKPRRLNPFDPLGSDVRINPLSDLVEAAKTGRPITDLAKSKSMLFRGDVGNGSNAWVGKAHIRIAWNTLCFLATSAPDLCTPAMLADIMSLPHDDFLKFIDELIASDACDGFVSAMGKKIKSEFREPTEQFEWVMADGIETFSPYLRGGAFRNVTSETNIDLECYKKKAGVLMFDDPEKLVFSHPAHFRVMSEYLINTVAYAKGDVHCNFLWDEFANYPATEAVIRGERLYRSKKCRFILIGQDENSFKHYEKWGGFEALAENSIQLILSCDGAIAERTSKKAGKHAVSIRQAGSNFGANMTANQGAQEVLINNLPVSMIAQGIKGKVIVDTRTDGIYILDRPPIWEIEDLQKYKYSMSSSSEAEAYE